MSQIHGSGAGNFNNTAIVDNSVDSLQQGRLWVSSSGTSNQIYDGSNGPAILDETTYAIVSIPYEHYEIHEGNHYFTKGWTNLATSGGSISFGFTTPNTTKWAHMRFDVFADNVCEMNEYEFATISGGTSQTIYNNNRNSNNNSVCTITQNPSITSNGSLFGSARFGVAGTNPTKQGITGGLGRNQEIILRSGTTYLWIFKVGGNNTIFNWDAEWYEHVNK